MVAAAGDRRLEPVEPFELQVRDDEAGERLDRMLSARDLGVSRATLQRWIDEGRVLINGQAAKRAQKVVAAASIRVEPGPPPTSDAIAQDIPLSVLFEDAHLLVVNKPAGLVVHPGAGHRDGTLVNALLFRGGVEVGAHGDRPGIVHRLDRDTSGVMVVAKTAAARDGLVALFSAHDIDREYQALVLGHVPETLHFDTWHGRHPVDRKRFTGKVSQGKRAVTDVARIELLQGASLVRCRLSTGRTHQIRVHLSEHGYPILADATYGNPPKDPFLRHVADMLGRQALHAGVLGFVHPITQQRLRFEAPLPDDMQRALLALRVPS